MTFGLQQARARLAGQRLRSDQAAAAVVVSDSACVQISTALQAFHDDHRIRAPHSIVVSHCRRLYRWRNQFEFWLSLQTCQHLLCE